MRQEGRSALIYGDAKTLELHTWDNIARNTMVCAVALRAVMRSVCYGSKGRVMNLHRVACYPRDLIHVQHDLVCRAKNSILA